MFDEAGYRHYYVLRDVQKHTVASFKNVNPTCHVMFTEIPENQL